MPFVEAFAVVAEDAAAEEAASVAAEEAASSAAAESAAASSAEAGAGAAGSGAAATEAATAAELSQAGLGQLSGYQGALQELGPAYQEATAIGGEGAGGAGVQSAMEGAMQKAPLDAGAGSTVSETAGSGITAAPQAPATTAPPTGEVATRGISQVPSADQYASINNGTMSDAGNGMRMPTSQGPDMSGYQRINDLADSAKMEGITQAAPQAAPEMTNAQFYEKLAADPGSTATLPQGTEGPGAWDKFSAFADKHPFMTGAALYTGAYKMGLLDPRGGSEAPGSHYDGPLSKYKLSDNFKGSTATPNVYKPQYKQYADGGLLAVGGPTSQVDQPRNVVNPMATVGDMNSGGIAGYAQGGVARYAKGNLTETLDYYTKMTEGPKASTNKGSSAPHMDADVGIYYDQDPDTRYQDALTAAQIRQSKLNKRSSMQLPSADVMKRPAPMGALNLAPPGGKAQQGGPDTTDAAHGGIMQASSHLGSYAAGGSGRLLKGPGDGMSDNIPATISGKQPARLADGEFVVPADVVSHLGNGSTDAGAKKLHQMMNEVRKARTGNPKQGKQINPNKFLPK